MTEPSDRSSDLDLATREAVAWVVRLTSGEATTEDAAELKKWRAQSPANEEAFRRAVKLWKDFGTVARHTHDAPAHRPHLDPVLARRAFIGAGLTALAASAVYAIVNPPLDLWPSLSELVADYRTAKGEQQQVVVSPEVSVELGTQTSLTVRSTDKQPRLELIAGEAAINSNAGAARPLVVLAADGEITAARASFNARCIDGFVSVTCLTGRVEVKQGFGVVWLDVGQQVSYSKSGLRAVIEVNPEEASSWRTGMLIFRDKPLTEVIEEVNRYRPGRIVVANTELGRRIINGTFRRDKLGNFIAQIVQLFGAKATTLPAGITILS